MLRAFGPRNGLLDHFVRARREPGLTLLTPQNSSRRVGFVIGAGT
jgi:hypothetical protein